MLAATVGMILVWLATHNQSQHATASLAVLDGASVAMRRATASFPEAGKVRPAIASIVPSRGERSTNSLTGLGLAARSSTGGPASAGANNALQLRFSGDSSVEIVGVDGRVIEHDTVEAGSVRSYSTSAVASVEIGSPSAVLVLRNGQPLNLKPFHDANQTRFRLSSAGEPAPVRD